MTRLVVFAFSSVAVAGVPSRRMRSSSRRPRSARSENNTNPAPISSQMRPTTAPVGAGTHATNAAAPAMKPIPITMSIT